ncbi:hypothetical protein KBK19_14030 [Microvirga sp. STR05]|uniref:Uncharacterized protein n=1 Tax=Hymenobacter duratus TaxID=2771356 RepID=A0ABR8JJB3_9BACT|nr:hypothetical protein [Hymenobacter duratus]MBD2716157.1 hypothetical protein [Hymenobacter duratus]MBR7951071.1 hypothetical protein [Microvirga sp. STR05]
MGKELRLSGQNFDPEAALQFVQRRFRVMQHDASQLSLALFATEETSVSPPVAWPPVFIGIEANGFYFCDNLFSATEAALIFKQLCEFMLTSSNEIRIAEL